MKRRTIAGVGIVVLAVCLVAGAQQTIQPGSQAVWKNAKGGAFTARRPGAMVERGIARFRNKQNDMLDRARRGPEITDTPADRPTKAITQAKVKAIQIIFDNLTALLLVINAQQRTAAGLSPLNPVPSGGTSSLPDLSSLLGSISGPSG